MRILTSRNVLLMVSDKIKTVHIAGVTDFWLEAELDNGICYPLSKCYSTTQEAEDELGLFINALDTDKPHFCFKKPD